MRLEPKPDAIVCSNDNMAIGAINWLQENGYYIPDSLVVTGFDNTEEGATSFPKLSTVHQPVYELAKSAVKILAESVRNGVPVPRETKIATRTVYRDSCGCHSQHFLTSAASPTKTSDLAQVCRNILLSESSRASLPAPLLQELESWVLKCIQHIASDPTRSISDFEGIIYQWRNEKTLSVVEVLLSELQAKILLSFDWQNDLRSAVALLGAALVIVHELKVIMLQRNRRETEVISSLLVETNRVLASSFMLDDLEGQICQSFPASGITGARIMLFDGNQSREMARVQAAMQNGKPEVRSRVSKPSVILCSELLIPQDREAIMVMPLYYRTEQLGIAFLQQTTKVAFVYDALTLQLSTSIEGALLFSRISKAEQDTGRQSQELKELVVPMLETLQKIAAETKSQTELVSGVDNLNQETTNRATQANQIFQAMREELESIVRLLGMINEISETVSVVAINASISAAHAGHAGKVFTVIAHEIRNLAANTNQRAEEAGKLIQGMAQKTGSYVQTNQATIQSFSTLSQRISSLASSLDLVANHIETLADTGKNLLVRLTTQDAK
jgi:hypothetical protein